MSMVFLMDIIMGYLQFTNELLKIACTHIPHTQLMSHWTTFLCSHGPYRVHCSSHQDPANSTYPCPIFSSFVYLRLGSPMETIVRNFSRISASVIFFFFGSSWLLFLATSSAGVSIGFVYCSDTGTISLTPLTWVTILPQMLAVLPKLRRTQY